MASPEPFPLLSLPDRALHRFMELAYTLRAAAGTGRLPEACRRLVSEGDRVVRRALLALRLPHTSRPGQLPRPP